MGAAAEGQTSLRTRNDIKLEIKVCSGSLHANQADPKPPALQGLERGFRVREKGIGLRFRDKGMRVSGGPVLNSVC